jgi:hypothetical protein
VKPSFSTLKTYHYSSTPGNSSYKSGADVYAEIGYDIDDLIKQDPGYENTCAVRMSLALIKAGVHFSGRIKIKAGDHKGEKIEPGAKRLGDELSKEAVFGKPDFSGDPKKAVDAIGQKKGVVLFVKITGYDGGHIDLIEPINALQTCNSNCYFNCREAWFWELK